MHYDDFAIHLDRGPDGGCRAQVRSPAGEAVGPVEVEVDAAQLEQISLVFGQRVRGQGTPAPDTGLEAALRAIGGRLFTGLFSAPIVHRFHHSLGGLGDQGSRGLRLRLQMSLDDPLVARLHGLPWELLFRAETGEFLALSRRLTVVRSVGLPVPIRRPRFSRPLRILVVASAPLGLPALAFGTEFERMKRAWEVRDEVKVEKLPRADLDCLRQELLRQEYHVLHFIGHGEFEKETGQGSLLFEAEDGTQQPVDGQLLAQQLRDFPSLLLVFLNACQTAQSAAAGPFAGVATALLQVGIPGVLALQFPMTDDAALVLSEMVYRRLADGDPIDAAVAEGRLAIRRRLPHSPEWGTPVLFLRAPDGQLIRTNPAAIRKRDWRLRPIRPSSKGVWKRVLFWGAGVITVPALILSVFLNLKNDEIKAGSQPPAGALLEGPLGIRMRYVPSGIFTIGSPNSEPGRVRDEALHKVKLTRGFWLAETELTQGQWTQLIPQNPSKLAACGTDCPVNTINWYEAVEFANRLSDEEGLERCYRLAGCTASLGSGDYTCKSATFTGLDCPGYRLPTEAEWEVAARARTTTAIYNGALTLRGLKNAPELDPIAWYGGNSRANYPGAEDCLTWKEKQYAAQYCGPHPVGQKKANSWGFHDMLGNVWEWTGDWYGEYSMHLTQDPIGPPTGLGRVFRGGSWSSLAHQVRSAYRYRNDLPVFRGRDLGLRLATCFRSPNNPRRGPCVAPL